MSDPDPPDEIDDGEPPSDRDVDAPDTDPFVQQIGDRDLQNPDEHEPDKGGKEPGYRGLPRQDNPADLFGDRLVGGLARTQFRSWRGVAPGR